MSSILNQAISPRAHPPPLLPASPGSISPRERSQSVPVSPLSPDRPGPLKSSSFLHPGSISVGVGGGSSCSLQESLLKKGCEGVGAPALAVSVLSAVSLERKQMDKIGRKMRRLTGCRELRVENTVDPSLIAGFVIRYEDEGTHVIDLSVKGQLAELAERIESSEKSRDQEQSWGLHC